MRPHHMYICMNFFLSIQKKRPLSKLNAGVAWEQALRGALAAEREKEQELTTTSLEFEYLHWKSRCKMLIGVDDISNDVITPRHVFSMFVYNRAPFRFVWLAEIWQLTRREATGELGVEFKFQRRSCKLSFLFLPQAYYVWIGASEVIWLLWNIILVW